MGKTLDFKNEIEQEILDLHMKTPHLPVTEMQTKLEKLYYLFKESNKAWYERLWGVLNDFNNLKNMNKVKNQNNEQDDVVQNIDQ